LTTTSKILIDSSIWIEYFRDGNSIQLDRLIEEDLICTNDVVLTELIPALTKNRNFELVKSLRSLENIPMDIDWEIIREYQILNLQNGIKTVGIADLIIIQQVVFSKLTLLSLDKHFTLMQKYLSFDLLELS
jgi:predicted nucleic acid-binding protein